MSFYLYTTRLKCLFRNKGSMFWCYAFPILMASLFFFAMNNLWNLEDFNTIPIAYDSEGIQNGEFSEVLSSAKMSDDMQMFDVTYCDKDEAKKLLQDGKIDAYIVGSENPVLYVKESEMNQTIAKTFLDQYKQMSDVISTILLENPNAIKEGLLDDVMQSNEFVEEVQRKNKPQSLLVYFYALLAYCCIFAANWGLDEVVNIQANLSEQGARLNVSSIGKMKLFLCNLLAAFTAHMGSLILVFVYMYYIIKVDFGNNIPYLLVICLLGSLCGLSLGGTVGIWVKKRREVKETILTMFILGGGFLAGMMQAQMKYIIAEKLPILSYINPVNLVSDGMYSLYYYETLDRYYLDAALLLIITIILGIASYIGIRRKNYASL